MRKEKWVEGVVFFLRTSETDIFEEDALAVGAMVHNNVNIVNPSIISILLKSPSFIAYVDTAPQIRVTPVNVI